MPDRVSSRQDGNLKPKRGPEKRPIRVASNLAASCKLSLSRTN
jgi:hypothetical protein